MLSSLFIIEVESDLPEDIRDDALRVFRSAVDQKMTIKVTNLNGRTELSCYYYKVVLINNLCVH